jgi:DNA-binding MarR family transcriptional regulator
METNLEELGRAVKQAQHRQFQTLETALSTVGTTLAQWDALRAISKNPGASAHALAVATFQTDQAFGTLANRLLVQGLIKRKAGVGRRIEHALTDTGGQTLAKANIVADKIRAELFSALSHAERAALSKILAKLLNQTPTGEIGDAG